jgi:hypothetical protein
MKNRSEVNVRVMEDDGHVWVLCGDVLQFLRREITIEEARRDLSELLVAVVGAGLTKELEYVD